MTNNRMSRINFDMPFLKYEFYGQISYIENYNRIRKILWLLVSPLKCHLSTALLSLSFLTKFFLFLLLIGTSQHLFDTY